MTGGLSAKSIVTNVQDFVVNVSKGLWPVEAGIRSFSGRNYENDMVMNGHPELLWFQSLLALPVIPKHYSRIIRQ